MEKEKVVKAGWEKRRAWETEYAEKKNGKMAVINELRGKVEEARRRVEVLRGEKDVAEAIRASEQATASPTETAKTPEPEVKLGEPYVENLEEKPAEPAAEKKEEQFFPYPKEYAPPPQGSADKPAEEKPAEAKEEQFFPYPKEYAPPPQDSGDKPAAADQPEEIEHKEEDYNDYPDPSDSPEPSAGVPEELPETKAYNEANEELRKLEDEIKREEEWVNKDFGEAGVWSGVGDGGCFEGGKGE